MGIPHIFISHAAEDTAIAETLSQHLKNAGHATKVDTHELTLGDDTIAFMNDAIAEASAIIILFSKNTTTAKWQKLEINSAIWNEMNQDGGKCIVIRLDDTPLPPVLGPKQYKALWTDEPDAIRALVEAICDSIAPVEDPSAIVADAFRTDSQNPFRHLRAEFLETEPRLHARTFALPESFKVGSLEEMKPSIVEGSRGTGKSMLLLALRARNLLCRTDTDATAPRHFGFYLKLTRGAICNAGDRLTGQLTGESPLPEALLDIAEQELYLQITESLMSELLYCTAEGLLANEGFGVQSFCEEADELLLGSVDVPASSFDELQSRLSRLHREIANFIRRRFIYGEQVPAPIATFDFNQFKSLLHLVRRHHPALTKCTFVVLLDEYENLFPYQMRLVNSLIKLGPPALSVNVARKLASGDVPGTTMGQDLQEIHDYTRIPLVYNLENPSELAAYHTLLRRMVANMTALELGQATEADELLPVFDSEEVDETEWLKEVAALSKKPFEAFSALEEAEQRQRRTYYGEAARYRCVLKRRGRRAQKRFAGFKDLAFLGSGVIRYFQEFLSVGYHLSYGADGPTDTQLEIPPASQTEAVHFVSQHNLTTLSRNVEGYGEALKYFLLDLGDCLRHKLLCHTSEPEAARLTLVDPESLQQDALSDLRQILAVGERESVFQTREGVPAFRPKHRSDPQPTEFNVCRVFAPALQISPRLRWRTRVKCAQLQGLLVPGRRSEALRALKREMGGTGPRPKAQDETLFPEGSTA